MGKKDASKMAAERSKFIAGAKAQGVDEKKATEIFDLMEKFAEYGFNKSHSAAYALISYHTAYLKTHFKPEFMAALLTSEMDNQEKLLKYVAACKDMGIKVEPPSIQESYSSFSVNDGRVIFGLGGVKNVGGEAIREIVEAREKDGPFASLLDLCCRVNLRKVTKRVLENLIKGGAMDALGCSRQALVSGLDLAVGRAQKKQKDANSGQMSMLGMMMQNQPEQKLGGIGIDCPEQKLGEWPDEVKLGFEKDALGFFLTSHPLQPYRREIQRIGLMPLEEVRELEPGTRFKTAVLVSSFKESFTKKGDRMAFCQVNDLTAGGECVIFPRAYEQIRDVLEVDVPFELVATVQREKGDDGAAKASLEDTDEDAPQREIRLIAESLRPLKEAVEKSDAPLQLELNLDELAAEDVDALKGILQRHSGQVGVSIYLYGQGVQCHMRLPAEFGVTPGPELGSELMEWEMNLADTAA